MLDYYRFKTVADLFMQGSPEEARLELAQLQRRYVALCDENTTFKMQVQAYEDMLYLARNLILDGQYYWLITGSIKQGPFCPHCYDRDGLLMRLAGNPGERFCALCRNRYPESAPVQELAMAIAQEFFSEERPAALTEKPRKKARVIPFGK